MRNGWKNRAITATAVLVCFGVVISFSTMNKVFAETNTPLKNIGVVDSTSILKKIMELKERLSALQKQLGELMALKGVTSKQASADFPLVSRDELAVDWNGINSADDYFKKFAELTVKISFDVNELGQIKKLSPKGDRAPMLEELIAVMVSGKGTEETRRALRAWNDLDTKMADALKKTAVSGGMIEVNRELVSWYAFHGSVAKQLSDPSITKDKIGELSNQYNILAPIHTNVFGKNIASIKNSNGFTLINKADAFTCGAFRGSFYHFGGKITFTNYCNLGVVDIVSIPCGGLIFFPYATAAINPYNWHNIYTISNAVLGRSIVGPPPFVCPVGCGVPPCGYQIPYEATALYYGTGPL